MSMTLMVEGIEVLFSRKTMVDPWNCLVTDMTNTLRMQIVIHLPEEMHGLDNRQTGTHHQTAIGKTVVRAECIPRLMGRQYS